MSTALLSSQTPAWHTPLLEYLPLIRAVAAKAFQGLSAAAREEAIQEVVADTTVGLAGLAAKGRAHFWMIPALARYAVRRQNAGRRVGTPTNKLDLLSPVPRAKAKVTSLEARTGTDGANWRQVVADSRNTDPAEAACFRIDFSRWLEELPARHRQVALALADGERPGELAHRLGVSCGRISQLRAELRDAWETFQSDVMSPTPLPAAA